MFGWNFVAVWRKIYTRKMCVTHRIYVWRRPRPNEEGARKQIYREKTKTLQQQQQQHDKPYVYEQSSRSMCVVGDGACLRRNGDILCNSCVRRLDFSSTICDGAPTQVGRSK